MYLAIDVGATKTLVAIFSQDGKIRHQQKIATAKKYDRFLKDLQVLLEQTDFHKADIKACCCALPGRLDRQKGIGIRLGNLPWKNFPIVKDLETILGYHKPVYIENDANLAGLAAAQPVSKKYKRALYITLSTGVGGGLVSDGVIDPDFLDFEPGKMILEHEQKMQQWEDIASGKALVKRFGQTADRLDNPFAWKTYAKGVAKGLDILLSILQPDVVIVGGGAGAHLEKFKEFLLAELKKYTNELVPLPPIIKANNPEEAVIYGCYEFIRQQA